MRTKTSCKRRACRNVMDKVCKFRRDCPWWNLKCHVKKWVCTPVQKVVCFGACKAWNYGVRLVANTVYTAGSCAAKGMVEVVKKFRCLQC